MPDVEGSGTPGAQGLAATATESIKFVSWTLTAFASCCSWEKQGVKEAAGQGSVSLRGSDWMSDPETCQYVQYLVIRPGEREGHQFLRALKCTRFVGAFE